MEFASSTHECCHMHGPLQPSQRIVGSYTSSDRLTCCASSGALFARANSRLGSARALDLPRPGALGLLLLALLLLKRRFMALALAAIEGLGSTVLDGLLRALSFEKSSTGLARKLLGRERLWLCSLGLAGSVRLGVRGRRWALPRASPSVPTYASVLGVSERRAALPLAGAGVGSRGRLGALPREPPLGPSSDCRGVCARRGALPRAPLTRLDSASCTAGRSPVPPAAL